MASSLLRLNHAVAKRYYRADVLDVVAETTIECKALDDLVREGPFAPRLGHPSLFSSNEERENRS